MLNYRARKEMVLILISLIFLCNYSYNCRTLGFNITSTEQGLLVEENGEKVLFYQKAVKSLKGKYSRNNYIHPLYNLDGDIITEDFPEDHPHHRGVFWAWHHVSVNDSIISDTWSLQNYDCNIKELTSSIDSSGAVINITALWSSPIYLEGTPYLKEQTKIKIFNKSENKRIIDFEISLLALTNGLRIGGAANNKGYGGFSPRFKIPGDLIFTSDRGQIIPQENQIKAGQWMDFSATFGEGKGVSGITLLSHQHSPDYTQSWILRKQNSMQNVVYPGPEPVLISTEMPSVLKYRMIIHSGKANMKRIFDWENEYK